MKKPSLQYTASPELPKLSNYKTEWDLTVYYKNEKDPKIDKDIDATIAIYKAFAKKWSNKKFTTDSKTLKAALTENEALAGNPDTSRPGRWFGLREGSLEGFAVGGELFVTPSFGKGFIDSNSSLDVLINFWILFVFVIHR